MNLRNFNIGLRLGMGFSVILLAAASMLITALVSVSANRTALLDTLQRASIQEEIANNMRNMMLSSAISVRNMGLQSKTEALQKDEAEAKRFRASYQEAKAKLEALGQSDQERELFKRLSVIDSKTDAFFKEAVDLAAQFNTEQAGAVITGKIDPLSTEASKELTAFIALQKIHKPEIQ